METLAVFIIFVLTRASLSITDNEFLHGTFPENFFFGASTSAYQIEGGWDEEGKGENIWDYMVHTNGSSIADNSTGDVAADSYHQYKTDVQLLKNLGVQYYRFSLSWSRLCPTGHCKQNVNAAGVRYYNDLIDQLLYHDIKPMITIYHWDLPQPLQNQGGWLNESIIEEFKEFADVAFGHFGDRVDKWITLNEPWVQSVEGYGWGDYAPQVVGSGVTDYQAAHNLIKSHATAWHLYDTTYRPVQKGEVGITLNCWWLTPKTSRQEDVDAAERGLQFKLGWFAHPIFSSEGDYPAVMRQFVDRHSREEGRSQSRLPTFTPHWINFIRGSADFLGLNHYTTHLAEHAILPEIPSYRGDAEVLNSFNNSWPQKSSAPWIRSVPWGIRRLINWIHKEYSGVKVIVTENGYADHGELEDNDRVEYYKGYINEVMKAVNIDGCNVAGYFAWSLLDNFEWAAGYTQLFGLHKVDFQDSARSRIAKSSARYYTKIIEERGFPDISNDV